MATRLRKFLQPHYDLFRRIEKLEGRIALLEADAVHRGTKIGVQPLCKNDFLQVERIKAVVAQKFGMPVLKMESKGRGPESISWPRQIAMSMSRDITNLSLEEISSRFGKRDHATVLHACAAVKNRCETDLRTAALCKELAGYFQTGGNGHQPRS